MVNKQMQFECLSSFILESPFLYNSLFFTDGLLFLEIFGTALYNIIQFTFKYLFWNMKIYFACDMRSIGNYSWKLYYIYIMNQTFPLANVGNSC